MKLSKAQRAAYDALRAAPDGALTSDQEHRRCTVEALARRGLATVHLDAQEREVRHHGGGTSRRSVVIRWRAELKPVVPGGEELAELDLIVERGERTLRGVQREHAAAYVAVMSPAGARAGAQVLEPGYNPVAAYAEHLAMDDVRLIMAYMVVRHAVAEVPPPLVPRPRGAETNAWVVLVPRGEDGEEAEAGRVRGSTEIDARIAASSLLDQRFGYRVRRLYDSEIGDWVKDFRAGGTVARMTSVNPSAGAQYFVVRALESETAVTTGATVAQTEHDARAKLAAPRASQSP